MLPVAYPLAIYPTHLHPQDISQSRFCQSLFCFNRDGRNLLKTVSVLYWPHSHFAIVAAGKTPLYINICCSPASYRQVKRNQYLVIYPPNTAIFCTNRDQIAVYKSFPASYRQVRLRPNGKVFHITRCRIRIQRLNKPLVNSLFYQPGNTTGGRLLQSKSLSQRTIGQLLSLYMHNAGM